MSFERTGSRGCRSCGNERFHRHCPFHRRCTNFGPFVARDIHCGNSMMMLQPASESTAHETSN